jgi:hypothetical protein
VPSLGKDCHLILQHADVNAGEPYGFICPKDNSPRELGVQVTREVSSDSVDETNSITGTQLWLSFDLLLADDLINPDGSSHAATRGEDYAVHTAFLAQPRGISLTTPAGTYTNLGALGWSADERHLPDHSIIRMGLNNVGYYFPPADPESLALSLWDGTLTWATSYWR